MHAAGAAASARLPFRRRLPSATDFPSFFRMSHFPFPSSSSTAVQVQTLTAAAAATDSPPAWEPSKPRHQNPWLIVGLGNPGQMFHGTRHNVGFEMVDAIAEAEGILMSSISFKSKFGEGFIGDVPVILAKPQTFMNASGESIFDDLDLPFAKLRLLPKGGHGGHNGMRSVIDHFQGNRDFPRLRIGIGRPTGMLGTISFVLHQFSTQESEELEFTFQTGLETVRMLLLQGFNKAASFVNSPKSLEQLG